MTNFVAVRVQKLPLIPDSGMEPRYLLAVKLYVRVVVGEPYRDVAQFG